MTRDSGAETHGQPSPHRNGDWRDRMNEREFLRQASMLLRRLTGCSDPVRHVYMHTKSETYHIHEEKIEVYS